LVTAMQTLDTAEANAKDALSTLRTTETNATPSIRALEHLVRAQFGSASQALADFDLAPPKPRRKLTSDQKAAAAKKAKATRALRGTLGPRQKARIKAVVESTQTQTTVPKT
jgi:hypothetical protein